MSTHTLGHTHVCIVHTQVKSLTDPEALIHQNLQGIISQTRSKAGLMRLLLLIWPVAHSCRLIGRFPDLRQPYACSPAFWAGFACFISCLSVEFCPSILTLKCGFQV